MNEPRQPGETNIGVPHVRLQAVVVRATPGEERAGSMASPMSTVIIDAVVGTVPGTSVGTAEVAGMLVDTWRRIDAALAPVIGHAGARALCQRTLELAASVHPWLSAADATRLLDWDRAAWQTALAPQDAAEAATACSTLLMQADRVLASLVGLSLAQRLLHPVWNEGRRLPPGRVAGGGR